jgi:hypothetical protein
MHSNYRLPTVRNTKWENSANVGGTTACLAFQHRPLRYHSVQLPIHSCMLPAYTLCLESKHFIMVVQIITCYIHINYVRFI